MVWDETVVRNCEPGHLLSLTAVGRPFGVAAVDLVLQPTAAGTEVTMTEEPVAGPGAWVHTRLTDALIGRRNVESLARLGALVVRKTAP